MEPIPPQSVFTVIPRQWYDGCHFRMVGMKSRVKARNLTHVRQSLANCFDSREIVGLLQGSQRYKFVQICQDLSTNYDWRGVAAPTVHDSVPNSQHVGPAETGS